MPHALSAQEAARYTPTRYRIHRTQHSRDAPYSAGAPCGTLRLDEGRSHIA